MKEEASSTSLASTKDVTKATKKPFDKRRWRENKYSNKAKMDRWQGRQERTMKRKYFKMLKKDGMKKSHREQVEKGDNANLEPLGRAGDEDRTPGERRLGSGQPGEGVEDERNMKGGNKERAVHDRSKSSAKARFGFHRAKLEFSRRQAEAEKKQRQEEKRRAREERQAALESYRKRKADRNKVLSKKTKKGQPVMACRMEMLLQKIQMSE